MATNFSQLHRAVLFGRSNGRIIWQPRFGCWVSDKRYAGEELPAPFTGMDFPDIHRTLNVSARIYEYNCCFKPIEHTSVTPREERINETDVKVVIETPVGKQSEAYRTYPASKWRRRLKWPIDCDQELKVATWRAEHTAWRWDQEGFVATAEKWGDLGAPTMYMPRIHIQSLYIDSMGVENAIFAIHDWPDAVEAYCSALDGSHDRLIDVINESPIEIINFGDNVHCGTLPPNLFCRYVLPSYQRRCHKLHGAGKFVHAHWDGDTKALLPYANQTGLDGIEAITPAPQGDVTLEQIKEALGDDLFLLDGIPAILFDETFPVSMLAEFAHRLIELFAPRLVLGISDEISSSGDIERIHVVTEIVDAYNAAQRAGLADRCAAPNEP